MVIAPLSLVRRFLHGSISVRKTYNNEEGFSDHNGFCYRIRLFARETERWLGTLRDVLINTEWKFPLLESGNAFLLVGFFPRKLFVRLCASGLVRFRFRFRWKRKRHNANGVDISSIRMVGRCEAFRASKSSSGRVMMYITILGFRSEFDMRFPSLHQNQPCRDVHVDCSAHGTATTNQNASVSLQHAKNTQTIHQSKKAFSLIAFYYFMPW